MSTIDVMTMLRVIFLMLLVVGGFDAQVPELVVQTGHAGFANRVVFSDDGRLIATTDEELIHVWEVASGRQVRTFEVREYGASVLLFTPDNRYLVVFGGGYYRTDFDSMAVYNLHTGRKLWDEGFDKQDVWGIGFDESGRNIVTKSAGQDREFSFDLRTGISRIIVAPLPSARSIDGRVTARLTPTGVRISATATPTIVVPVVAGDVQALSLDRAGGTLAITGEEWITFWNTRTASQFHKLAVESLYARPEREAVLDDQAVGGPQSAHHRAILSPDARFIEFIDYASVGTFSETTVGYFNVSDGKPADPIAISEYATCYSRFHASHDREWSRFAINDCEGSRTTNLDGQGDRSSDTVIVDLADRGRSPLALRGFSGSMTIAGFLGNRTIFTRDERGLRTWDGNVRHFEPETLAVSPDGSFTIKGCEIEDPQLVGDWARLGVPENGCEAKIEWQAVSESERSVGEYPDIVTIRDAETRHLKHKLIGHRSRVIAAAFGPDGQLATADKNGGVKLWNTDRGELKAEFDLKRPIRTIAFVPRSVYLAFDVGLIDLKTGHIVSTEIYRHSIPDAVLSLPENGFSFTPDGQLVASLEGRCLNGDTYFAQLQTVASDGFEWFSKQNFVSQTSAVAFSDDGKLLALGHGGCTTANFAVDVIDLRTRRAVSMQGHKASVKSVRFSPDSKFLISTSGDGTAKLWRSSNGKLLATFFALGKEDWVIVSPDGRFDTNKPLDNIEGLYWLLPDEPLKPVSLDLFIRQYYEPGLLNRLLECHSGGSCSRAFKQLPSIAQINRSRPILAKPRTRK